MTIKKQYLKNKSQCKVTFLAQKEMGGGGKEMHVVGEFNQWDKCATPMKKDKNGTFAATVNLDLNKKYQFRYLADGVNWFNDAKADAYIHSVYGNCDNSVIVI
jgi:1,4-alpha-glucan branching enzyme